MNQDVFCSEPRVPAGSRASPAQCRDPSPTHSRPPDASGSGCGGLCPAVSGPAPSAVPGADRLLSRPHACLERPQPCGAAGNSSAPTAW